MTRSLYEPPAARPKDARDDDGRQERTLPLQTSRSSDGGTCFIFLAIFILWASRVVRWKMLSAGLRVRVHLKLLETQLRVIPSIT